MTRRRRERRRAAPAPEAKSKPSKRGVPWILVALPGMLAWGMPWDAFAAYRQSERADSTVAEFARKADRLMAAMERPTSRAEAGVAP